MFNIFKKKITVIFHMRSGHAIKFRCTDINVKHDGEKLTSYSIQGVNTRSHDPLMWVSVSSIESIEVFR